jgi:hypothetical protein
MAEPEFKDSELILRFAFPFHLKRLDEAKNRELIQDIIRKQTGIEVSISCVLDKNLATKPAVSKPEMRSGHTEPLDTISNIFGNVEMLE